ncbi:hypothetical protein H5410_058107 [Solanum commersonii]|uniref:Uncharacterized protein n=1 Tax=Solanum commersonii TaxID=4109 RepID=A0A9J5WRP0_SOLCO|nr:hypothetical protein H5410_058107 [Solanum commersonii]
MGKDETRQFYINATMSPSSISSIVRGKHITLTPNDITQILGISNTGWCHYVKRNWPPLDGLPSALDIAMGSGWVRYLSISKYLLSSGKSKPLKMFLGTVNQTAVPTLGRGANAPLQRLCAQLTLKDEEIAALRASRSSAMDQLHVSYGLEHASLVEENSNLKDELAKAATALENDKSTNTANLKDLFDLFKTTPPVVSPVITPSQPF